MKSPSWSDLNVGDVLCTRNAKGWPARMIRLGAAVLDKPNTVNHVIIVHHEDRTGTLWGIEGRPGGVGYVDLRRALKSPWTVANTQQPKTLEQRQTIADVAESLLGTPYDWHGIAQDGMIAIGADKLWESRWDDSPPAHVVCSSLADWVYEHLKMPSPGRIFDRHVTPGDWAEFIIEHRWTIV